MVSWDYFVGFVSEPVKLESFLESLGYEKFIFKKNPQTINYQSSEGGLIDIFYFNNEEINPDEEEEEDRVPNWNNLGYNVTSEIMISTKESNEVENASSLADKLVKEYDGILYDTDLDMYFTKEDI